MPCEITQQNASKFVRFLGLLKFGPKKTQLLVLYNSLLPCTVDVGQWISPKVKLDSAGPFGASLLAAPMNLTKRLFEVCPSVGWYR